MCIENDRRMQSWPLLRLRMPANLRAIAIQTTIMQMYEIIILVWTSLGMFQ